VQAGLLAEPGSRAGRGVGPAAAPAPPGLPGECPAARVPHRLGPAPRAGPRCPVGKGLGRALPKVARPKVAGPGRGRPGAEPRVRVRRVRVRRVRVRRVRVRLGRGQRARVRPGPGHLDAGGPGQEALRELGLAVLVSPAGRGPVAPAGDLEDLPAGREQAAVTGRRSLVVPVRPPRARVIRPEEPSSAVRTAGLPGTNRPGRIPGSRRIADHARIRIAGPARVGRARTVARIAGPARAWPQLIRGRPGGAGQCPEVRRRPARRLFAGRAVRRKSARDSRTT
jgi:hypothetical protein